MRKLLAWFDHNLLKIIIGFLIAFIPLWPKLPLFKVPHTWVYIRLEDIFIAIAFFWWGICLLQKKATLKTPLTFPIILYWIIGGFSLVFTLIFTAKHLANFFPNVAIFHYLRRIEYLGIFFVAFSSVKSKKDLAYYIGIIIVTILLVVSYGVGQKVIGLPAYLTMNEEFAKGIPLRLASNSRLTSTFGGHYDLAAYLVLMLAFLTAVFFGIKNIFGKIIISISFLSSLLLLLWTASRVSFIVYLIAVSLSLWWSKKKILIIPVIFLSIFMMTFVSGASERFLKTFRVRQIVYDVATGRPIATLEDIPGGSIEKDKKIYVPITTDTQENLPVGSGFIGLPTSLGKDSEATSIAMIKKPVPQSLKMSTISAEIATISGSFLIQKALVYDISFTTRFQGEWPRAIEAFNRNILFGSGYSSVSLATDNDYLRLLAETGILGAIPFFLIFIFGGIFLSKSIKKENNSLIKSAGIGLAGGVSGLLINAVLIDIFEASKVALSLWMLTGIVMGSLYLDFAEKINYKDELIKILKTNIFALIIIIIAFIPIISTAFSIYFVGDDFTWIRWVSDIQMNEIYQFFTQTGGFFYRPLAKLFYFTFYNIFWLQQEGYRLAGFSFHIFVTFLLYLILKKFSNRLFAYLGSLTFLVLAIHSESLFWTAAGAELLAPLFALFSFYLYINNRKALSSILLFFSLLGHESMIVFPIILIFYDLCFKRKIEYKVYLLNLILIFFYLELRFLSGSHWLNGDYSYNLRNFPLNFFGNSFSYLFGILGGPRILLLFNNVRQVLREEKLIAWLILGVITVFCVIIIIKKKINKNTIYNNPMSFFSFGAFIISLMPFIGLGNTSERYAYFPSVWLIIFLISLYISLSKRKNLISYVFIGVLSAFLIVINIIELKRSEKEWVRAGNITYASLAAIRNSYLPLPKNTTLYVNNLPIRLGRAWIFPVGFEDGLWMTFHDDSLRIEKIGSIEEGLLLQKKNPKSHVITFEDYEIKEVR